MNDTRARINLALSILTHADEEHLDRAAREATLALEGVSLADLYDLRRMHEQPSATSAQGRPSAPSASCPRCRIPGATPSFTSPESCGVRAWYVCQSCSCEWTCVWAVTR